PNGSAPAATPESAAPATGTGGADGSVSATIHAYCPPVVTFAMSADCSPSLASEMTRHSARPSSHDTSASGVAASTSAPAGSVSAAGAANESVCGVMSATPTGDQPAGSSP